MKLSGKVNFYAVVILFAIYLINGIIAIPRNSVTYDEMDHWSYGKRILMRKTEKVYTYDDASAMPVSGVNAMPRAFQQLTRPGLLKSDGGFSDIMNGRYVTLIICLLTSFFIYTWSRQLFGDVGGLLSLFLFVFCPNLNGNAILLTTDAYTALIVVASAYYFWKFIKQSGWRKFIAFSICLGIAQIVKYSSIHLFILFALVSLIVLVKRKTIISGWKRNLSRLIILTVIVMAIINAGFLFNNVGKSIADINTASKNFTELKSSFIGKIPLPLPQPYIEGIDLTTHMNELGAGHPNVSAANYILGEKKTGTGFWYYYMVAFIFKTPLSVLLILIGAILFLFFRKKYQGHPSTMLFLLGFIFYFLIVLGIQNNVQIGIRHALMVYPMVYVLAGFIATLNWFKAKQKLILPVLVIYSLATYYFFFPNLLSYSNELILDKKSAYKVMADSNLDFGQGVYALEEFLKSNPDVKFATDRPEEGNFIVVVNDYLNLNSERNYSWVNKAKPLRHVDHCFLLLHVTQNDLDKK